MVVNEVLAHDDYPLYDSIELYNTTNAAVNISGWYLSDSSDDYKKYRIPDGTVLRRTSIAYSPRSSSASYFGLSSTGDDVWLMQADALGNLTYFADHVEFRRGQKRRILRTLAERDGQLVSHAKSHPRPGQRHRRQRAADRAAPDLRANVPSQRQRGSECGRLRIHRNLQSHLRGRGPVELANQQRRGFYIRLGHDHCRAHHASWSCPSIPPTR